MSTKRSLHSPSYAGRNFDFRRAFAHASATNASKGNAPGFPNQFRWATENFSLTRTPELININTNPGPDIPVMHRDPPFHFDGMIPDVAFTTVTDTRTTTHYKIAAGVVLLIGLIIIFGKRS